MRWLVLSVLPILIGEVSEASAEPPSVGQHSPPAANRIESAPIIEIELDRSVEARDQPVEEWPERRRSVWRSQYRSGVEDAIFRSLDWLVEHQWADGGWSFDHTGAPRCAGQCGDPGKAVDARPAASALVLLALLGTGDTHRRGKYVKPIGQGLHFLLERIDGKPCMLPGGGQWVTADAWIATVLASLISQTGDQSLIPPAQRALDRLVRLQDRTTGGWPTIRDETVDPAATAWAIGALHGARLARQLDVPPEVLATALTSLDRMQRADCHSIPPKSEDPTGDPTQDYFTSQALRQQPSDRTNLGLWNRKLRSRLIESQCTDGHARGSWRPSQHGTAEAGGRLYETVLNALALEVYFQHLPIWRSVPGTEPEPRDDVLQHKREELPP